MYYYNNPNLNHYNYQYGLSYSYPTSVKSNESFDLRLVAPRSSFSREEAAAIALLLGIDFNKTQFDLNEFWMGVNVELEHGTQSSQSNVTGDDPMMTGKIALAHLNEFPDYYQRLKKLEEEAKAFWSK